MGLPCAHIIERRALENRGLFLNDLASHWLFYRVRPSLSTPLSVCSRVLQPEQDTSHADYNHEFQPEIDPFLEFKSPSQIKTKGRSPGAKNKRSSVEAGLGENSTRRDLSRFEHNVDQTSQIGVEHDRVGRGGRVNRTNRGGRASRVGRGGRVGRANRGGRVSRTAGGGRVGRANQVGRVGRARTRVEEAGIAETD